MRKAESVADRRILLGLEGLTWDRAESYRVYGDPNAIGDCGSKIRDFLMAAGETRWRNLVQIRFGLERKHRKRFKRILLIHALRSLIANGEVVKFGKHTRLYRLRSG